MLQFYTNTRPTLFWTCGDLFKIPIKYDAVGNVVMGTGTNFASVFKIPYDSLVHIIYIMVVEMHFTYSDFCNMAWHDIWDLFTMHQKRIEEQNKNSETQQSNMQSQINAMTPKLDMNSYKLPEYKVPNLTNMNNLKF